MVGDPTITAEELLAEVEWVKRLALALVHDEPEARDLAQSTFEAALARPPRAPGPLRPWLAGVVRNLARLRLRRDERRRRREQADSPSVAGLSSEQLVERAQTHQLVTRLVLELDEPFRSVVLLRYYEGLSAAEIARQLNVPAGTIRWQLKRGLDELRGGLEAASGDRQRWVLAVAPLARGLGQGTPVTALLAQGVLAMKAIKVVIGVVAMLAVIGVVGLTRYARRPPPAPPSHAAPPDAGAEKGRQRFRPTRPALLLLPGVTSRDETASGGAFEGRVVSAITGRGIATAELTFDREGSALAVTSGADGTFRFAPARPGSYALATVTAAGFLPFAPEWGQSPVLVVLANGTRIRNAVISLTPAIDFLGVVLDPGGRPVPGAHVRIVRAGGGEVALAPLPDRFTSDSRGEFHFHAPEDSVLEARHDNYAPGVARLDSVTQANRKLVIRLGPNEVRGQQAIAGQVVNTEGTPMPGVVVSAEFVDDRPPTPRPPLHPLAQATTDGSGRFQLDELDLGKYDLISSYQGVPGAVARRVSSGTRDLLMRISTGGRLRGTVRDQAGNPVAAFAVVLARRATALEDEPLFTRSFFDAAGRYELQGLAVGTYRVVVAAHGSAPSVKDEVKVAAAPAAPAVADFTLGRGGRVTGSVVERGTGTPLVGAQVVLEGRAGVASDLPLAGRTVSGADGGFVLDGLPPGLCSILVTASDHHGRLMSGLRAEPNATLGPITIGLSKVEPGEEPSIEFVGIGVALGPKDDVLVVSMVAPAGGAAAAGIVTGDAILRVDGQSVIDLGFENAVQMIRGPEGSTVVLTVRRAATGTVEEVPVLRKPLRN